jgi:hypothetical protein
MGQLQHLATPIEGVGFGVSIDINPLERTMHSSKIRVRADIGEHEVVRPNSAFCSPNPWPCHNFLVIFKDDKYLCSGAAGAEPYEPNLSSLCVQGILVIFKISNYKILKN